MYGSLVRFLVNRVYEYEHTDLPVTTQILS
jgi:hypothetical protein